MASKCKRLINRTSLSSIKTSIKPASRPVPSLPRSTPSPLPRFNFSRIPLELGCVQSLLPFHSTVAAARMTSCLSTTSTNFRALSQDEIDGT